MREGINDKILAKVMSLNSLASGKINEKLKSDKPFASEKMDDDTLLWAVNNLGMEDMMELQKEYPREQLNKLLYETAMIEQRRRKNG